MRRVAVALVAGIALAAVAACSGSEPAGVFTCAGVNYYALDLSIRDQFQQAQALGATVTITDGSYRETNVGADTLHVFAAEQRGGYTYDVRVSKPYFEDAVITGVKTGGSSCISGAEAAAIITHLPVMLRLASGAPAVRALHVQPTSALIDRPPYSTSVTPRVFFDANPDVSRAVTWSITGAAASVLFDPASGTVSYRCVAKTDSVTVTARSVVDTTVFDRFVVRFQGHPANSSDPPC